MYKVLMVCLGNICRSPLAQGILEKKSKESNLNIYVDSAGTTGWHVGSSPDLRSIKVAQKYDIDISHQKGEFVILISSADKIDLIEANSQLDKILPILCAEMGTSKAAKLAAKITGIDKKHCYKRATSL